MPAVCDLHIFAYKHQSKVDLTNAKVQQRLNGKKGPA